MTVEDCWLDCYIIVKPRKSYILVLQAVTWLSHCAFCFVAYLSSSRLILHSDRWIVLFITAFVWVQPDVEITC